MFLLLNFLYLGGLIMKILTSTTIIYMSMMASTPSVAQVAESNDTQQIETTESTPQAIISEPIGNVLRTGTPITLRMVDTLSSKKKKKQKVGDRFQMEVADDYITNNLVVIPAGTRATGEITFVKKSGMWGKRGRLNARVLYMTLGDRQIRLSGAFDESGSAGTAGVVGAVAVLPVAGFFVKGSNAEITPGTKIEAFLDEDLAYSLPASETTLPANTVADKAAPATPSSTSDVDESTQ